MFILSIRSPIYKKINKVNPWNCFEQTSHAKKKKTTKQVHVTGICASHEWLAVFLLPRCLADCAYPFRYIGVHFTFGLLDCVCYNEDFIISRFVILRFCAIQFTVTLSGLKNIIRYTEDFVI